MNSTETPAVECRLDGVVRPLATWTRRSMCMNVEGFMQSNRFPRGYDIFQHDDGKPMPPDEALAFLVAEKARGHKVIPVSAQCRNPCTHANKGCDGFDYAGGGCPGYAVAAPAA